uniref:Sorting nexin 8 n=1 Tax=Timema cristinae TaxID=61476 RepID=A0A7R9GTA5_TIMCR|nr:unnamed protein product [Timema cristinae]
MATDLSFGSVPPYYREVYDICAPTGSSVSKDFFTKLLVKSGLPSQTLSLIWELVDAKQGSLPRSSLYKALALVALAQQGRQPSAKLLDNFSGEGDVSELPCPELGDLSDLKQLTHRDSNPTRLGLRYPDLYQLDSINLDVVPEKKGLFLKHIEYQVSSKRFGALVRRRYNDFVALHELLLGRFPYRLIPKLPPKRVVGGYLLSVDSLFIEDRRKSLRRWLTLVARHPALNQDPLLNFFLTYTGPDLQHKIREVFRRVPDEFTTSELAAKAKVSRRVGVFSRLTWRRCLRAQRSHGGPGIDVNEMFLTKMIPEFGLVNTSLDQTKEYGVFNFFPTLCLEEGAGGFSGSGYCLFVQWQQCKELVPLDTHTEFANSRDQIRVILNGVSKLKQIADILAQRSHGYAADMTELGSQLSALASEPHGSSLWATGGNRVWADMKRGFHIISKEFALLSSHASQQATREEDEVCEKLNLLLDVLVAHRELCDRHEKGVAQDHAKALAKMLALKKRQMQGVIQGTDAESVDQLESKMMDQENVIANMELRNYFSLHCLHMETQLVHAHLEILATVLSTLVSVQIRGHSELADVWAQIQPTVEKCLPEDSHQVNGTSK